PRGEGVGLRRRTCAGREQRDAEREREYVPAHRDMGSRHPVGLMMGALTDLLPHARTLSSRRSPTPSPESGEEGAFRQPEGRKHVGGVRLTRACPRNAGGYLRDSVGGPGRSSRAIGSGSATAADREAAPFTPDGGFRAWPSGSRAWSAVARGERRR